MLQLWARRLRAVAGPIPPTPQDPAAFVRTFADEVGHRRSIDRPFLAHLLRVDPGPRPPDPAPDADLWWGLHGHDCARPGPLGGPLVNPAGMGLETWTEAELSSLHALSWHARLGREWAADRIDPAVEWVMENLQPDNATNHPWAIHVFLEHAERRRAPESRLYAETLLHNCLASRGYPDVLSACILADAADWLEGRGMM